MTATTGTGELSTVPTAPPPEIPAPSSPAESTRPGATVVDRMRSLGNRRLTAPGGVALAVLVLAPGVLLDLALDGTFGIATTVTFVAAGAVAALSMRLRALATAAVLPPLLFVAAVTVLARFSGNNQGNRELVLDVGTTLAISAPVLFGGTVATLAVVLVRVVAGLLHR